MIDTINDDSDLDNTIDELDMFHSGNDNLTQIDNDPVMDVNEHSTNADEGNSTSSEDESLSSLVCVPVNYETDDLIPSTTIDSLLAPMDEIENNSNIDKMREYLQTQCYEGSKWYHSLKFEGTMDKKTFSNIDIIQYVGNSCYKDKKDKKSYRIYLNPQTYPTNLSHK